MSAKEENTESVKIRGGRLSLCTGIILLLLAAALGAWQFYQPPQLDQLRSLVVQYTSFLSGTLSTQLHIFPICDRLLLHCALSGACGHRKW